MKRKTFLPLSRPSFSKKEEIDIIKVLRTGWITSGPKVSQFEKDFAIYTGVKHAISVSSGTAALHLALLALGIKSQDEVITVSFSWAATANVIVNVGAKPVFVDIDTQTHNIDTELIENKISCRTKAIMPIHFAGLPCDMYKISKIAKKYKLYVIEDAAHAIGTIYNNKNIGCLSDLTCFSFHPIKNITTGEGGMITTNNDNLAEKLKLYRFHGVTKNAWQRYSAAGKINESEYDIILPGFKYNMTDLQACLGIHQLKKLNGFIKKRAFLARIYDEGLTNNKKIILPAKANNSSRHSWNLYTIKINSQKTSISRAEFIDKLREKNIGTGIHFPAIHLSSYYQKNYPIKDKLLNTEFVSANILSLPLFPKMKKANIEYVVKSINKILN